MIYKKSIKRSKIKKIVNQINNIYEYILNKFIQIEIYFSIFINKFCNFR